MTKDEDDVPGVVARKIAKHFAHSKYNRVATELYLFQKGKYR